MRPMRLNAAALIFTCVTAACSGGSDGDPGDGGADAMAAAMNTGDAPLPETCNQVTHRANLQGPFTCPDAPEFIEIQGDRHAFQIFKYEASHPLGTETSAFVCASTYGVNFEAPDVPTPACSRKGVRPWHSVRWDDASAACLEVGDNWRMCTSEELLRACQGPRARAYTWGTAFDGKKCNIREVYLPEGAERVTEAPTGQYEGCVSPEGVFDLNGNVWEWVADRDAMDARAHTYQGAGWRIIPQRHDDSQQTCEVKSRVPGISAASFADPNVGFRCCRDAR